MQQKNLFIFLLLTIVVMAGWSLLQPARKPRPKPDQIAKKQEEPPPPGKEEAKQQPKLVEPEKKEPAKPPAKPKKQQPPRLIYLGSEAEDSGFNFRAAITSQGAGIQELLLNKFRQADRLGKPVNPPEPLHLIPDNADAPSNRLYHYGDPTETQPKNPLETLGEDVWNVVEEATDPDADEHRVTFTIEVPGQDVIVTKTYSLKKGTYHLGLTLAFQLKKGAKGPRFFRYQLTGAHGLPIEGEWYTSIYRNAYIGQVDSAGRVWRDYQDSRSIGVQDGGHEVLRIEDENRFIRYAAIATQYFASVLVVDNQQEQAIKQNFLQWVRPTLEGAANVKKPYLDDITVRAVSEPIELKEGAPVIHKYLLYNGPVKVRLLSQLQGEKAVAAALVDRYENQLHLNTLTDYHSQTGLWWVSKYVFNPIGWTSVLIACTNIMHLVLWGLHQVIPNYGLCILALTILVRGMMFPLSRRQALASARMQEVMQKIQPEMKKLEEKYKNDPRLRDDPWALHKAKMDLQSKHGMAPGAMFGTCWIVLLQMPIFMGLYYALQESIHFRLAPFLWMDNLSAPDMLFSWGENIPFISRPEDQGSLFYLGPFFNLLPIIAVTLMIVQQKMMALPPADEQQAMQQKMMKYMMVFMGLMFYKVAAGLCLYFIASSLWGVAERKLLPKRKPAGAGVVTAGKPVTAPPPSKKQRAPKENGDGTFQKVKDWWDDFLKAARK